jgi:major vault protein
MSEVKINKIIILPYHYIHVKDVNTFKIRLINGPKIFVPEENVKIITGNTPLKMIVLPPRHYCVIKNPILKD